MFIIERIWVRFWGTRISYDLLFPRSNFFSEYVPLTQLKAFLKNLVCFDFIRRRSLCEGGEGSVRVMKNTPSVSSNYKTF
jgi:hypothetical protein